jgi:hypothetical protein
MNSSAAEDNIIWTEAPEVRYLWPVDYSAFSLLFLTQFGLYDLGMCRRWKVINYELMMSVKM